MGSYWVPISQKNGSLLGPYLKAWGPLLDLLTVECLPVPVHDTTRLDPSIDFNLCGLCSLRLQDTRHCMILLASLGSSQTYKSCKLSPASFTEMHDKKVYPSRSSFLRTIVAAYRKIIAGYPIDQSVLCDFEVSDSFAFERWRHQYLLVYPIPFCQKLSVALM